MRHKSRTDQSGPKRKKRNDFSGNHQRGWMWGHHAVIETLATGTWPAIELYANQKAFDEFSDLITAKQQAGIRFELVNSDRLEQLCGSSEHQGLVARMGAFPYQTLESLTIQLDRSESDSAAVPLVVICDRLQDAFNFGAVLRCCDGANVLAVIVGDHSQAEVTPHVARSSSGAVNHLTIVQVADLIATSLALKELGLQLVAADANTKTNVWSAKLTGPTALIIGSEAHGICEPLLEICDQRLCIPMQGKVTSLNAAVAAGILLYEIRRQQFSLRN
ncbi:MAG TPA: 23S rRNA (guanosine(2251)-2'-O)-methyltransferase RlmB [Planctomycetaceae bacterium]|nr:23S rRNA (guanosine(2251)-2'-O)-methyltransferase RlmB [Planctomycetaceae bacterium]